MWWHGKTRAGKFAIALAVVLFCQIALALSTQYTILFAVRVITHDPYWGGELGTFLLFFIQLLLCIPTAAALVTFIAVIAWRAHRDRRAAAIGIPNDHS